MYKWLFFSAMALTFWHVKVSTFGGTFRGNSLWETVRNKVFCLFWGEKKHVLDHFLSCSASYRDKAGERIRIRARTRSISCFSVLSVSWSMYIGHSHMGCSLGGSVIHHSAQRWARVLLINAPHFFSIVSLRCLDISEHHLRRLLTRLELNRWQNLSESDSVVNYIAKQLRDPSGVHGYQKMTGHVWRSSLELIMSRPGKNKTSHDNEIKYLRSWGNVLSIVEKKRSK